MLEILEISKKFVNSSVPVLDRVSLTIADGECLSLLGPSGCGKTTLLRILAGLETPDSGRIVDAGRDLTGVPATQRPFHMVFQRHALFPHLSVFENVAFGLHLQKVSRDEIERRVTEVLALVRLTGFEDRMPSTLSGGQSQRVAVARALVNRPRVLLLDEPFSALDLKLRESMATELRDLQRQLKLTFIFVTHDQQEAFALSDRVALMHQGKIRQVCTPREIYRDPNCLFVADFVGAVSKFPATDCQSQSDGRVRFRFGTQQWSARPGPAGTGERVALVRPESFYLVGAGQPARSGDNVGRARLVDGVYRGSSVLLRARFAEGHEISLSCTPQEWSHVPAPGQEIEFAFRPEDTLLCPVGETPT